MKKEKIMSTMHTPVYYYCLSNKRKAGTKIGIMLLRALIYQKQKPTKWTQRISKKF